MRVLLFMPPLVQLIVFGFAVNLDVDHARIAWMDMDRTPESRDAARRASRARAASMLWRWPRSEEDVQHVLDRGEAQAVVRVLPDSRATWRAGAPPKCRCWSTAPTPTRRRWFRATRGRGDRGLFGGRDGSSSSGCKRADAQSGVAGERVGAAGDGAQPRVVQPRPAQPQLLRARRDRQHHHDGDADADGAGASCAKRRSAPWSS